MWPQLEPLLAKVAKPARYIGLEDGAQRPDHSPDRVAWLLAYPDTYEIGLPNQGLQILYEILNERADAVAERSYAPWTDLEELLRARGLPLFSVDTHRPAADFDVLAFNLSAELTYTNLLNMVDLAGVPVRAADRRPEHPLVAAGGHCTYNPEPIADFLDFVVLGDGEEVVGEITEVVGAWKASGRTEGSREHVLRALSHIPGVYVPSMYELHLRGRLLVATTPRYPDVPEQVEKRTIADLAEWPYPKHQLVPLTEVVHDRLNVEVFRGCTRGCRFCQAGMITRPVRERPAEQVRTMVADGLKRTGYDEVALTSLSTADFSGIEPLVGDIVKSTDQGPPGLGVAAQPAGRRLHRGHRHPDPEGPPHRPHLRPRGRHLAHAPGHQQAHPRGRPLQRRRLRLLPGLAAHEALLPHRPAHRDRRGHPRHRRAGPQLRRDRQEAHQEPVGHGVGRRLRAQAVHPVPVVRPEHRRGAAAQDQPPARRHPPQPRREAEVARPQGHPGRGHHEPRRPPPGPGHRGGLARGGTFQEWSEHFDLTLWHDAMANHGLDPDWYVHRHRTEDEVLPWDHLSAGLHKDFLWQDWRDALAEVGLPDCRWTPCYDCGACTGYGIEHIVASATPPAGGCQGTGQDLSHGAVPGRPAHPQAGAVGEAALR